MKVSGQQLICKQLLVLRLESDCCVLSVKKYCLGTSKCPDQDVFTLQQEYNILCNF